MSIGNASFNVGELVEVRSAEEILATLDPDGRLDGMYFMPEMLGFCGQQLRVRKVAHKGCDTVCGTGNRAVKDAVHLETARCDGSAHDGCQAGCNIYWKTAWLRKAESRQSHENNSERKGAVSGCTVERLRQVTRYQPADSEALRYNCQTTRFLEASKPLRWWDPRQYVRDVTSGNVPLLVEIKVLILSWFWAWKRRGFPYRLSQWTYNKVHLLLTGKPSPLEPGLIPIGQPTPVEKLDLRVGEWVRIKPHSEIRKTNTQDNKNRGMIFDPELTHYCEQDFKVLRRVDRMISEITGEMITMKTPCVILDGTVCKGHYTEKRMLCPREYYPYWREIWLERIGSPKKSPD